MNLLLQLKIAYPAGQAGIDQRVFYVSSLLVNSLTQDWVIVKKIGEFLLIGKVDAVMSGAAGHNCCLSAKFTV